LLKHSISVPPWTIDRVKQDIAEKSLKDEAKKAKDTGANTKVWLSCHV